MNTQTIANYLYSSTETNPQQKVIKVNSPIRLLYDQLRDLYSMEIQLAGSLCFIADQANHAGLKELIAKQSYRTYRRKVQLLVIFRCHDLSPGTDKCRVIEGLVRVGDNNLTRIDDAATRDLMILSHCIRISQYGLSGYGIAAGLARRIGYVEEAEALSLLQCEEDASSKALKEMEAEIFDLAHATAKNLVMIHH
jgi:ferritin-like metal-binding protein YciE